MNEVKKYTILFVDDDEFIVDIYATKILERGHQVIPCQSAKIALQKLHDGAKPNIIVADIIMPHMNGFEFVKVLRDEHLADTIPVVVLSNQSEPEDFARMKDLRVAGQFIKAQSLPDEMVSKIEQVIQNWKQ